MPPPRKLQSAQNGRERLPDRLAGRRHQPEQPYGDDQCSRQGNAQSSTPWQGDDRRRHRRENVSRSGHDRVGRAWIVVDAGPGPQGPPRGEVSGVSRSALTSPDRDPVSIHQCRKRIRRAQQHCRHQGDPGPRRYAAMRQRRRRLPQPFANSCRNEYRKPACRAGDDGHHRRKVVGDNQTCEWKDEQESGTFPSGMHRALGHASACLRLSDGRSAQDNQRQPRKCRKLGQGSAHEQVIEPIRVDEIDHRPEEGRSPAGPSA